MKIFGYALDYGYPRSLKDEDPKLAEDLDSMSIKEYTEAKEIFEILEELDTTQCYNWGVIAKERIEHCNNALSRKENNFS